MRSLRESDPMKTTAEPLLPQHRPQPGPSTEPEGAHWGHGPAAIHRCFDYSWQCFFFFFKETKFAINILNIGKFHTFSFFFRFLESQADPPTRVDGHSCKVDTSLLSPAGPSERGTRPQPSLWAPQSLSQVVGLAALVQIQKAAQTTATMREPLITVLSRGLTPLLASISAQHAPPHRAPHLHMQQ